MGRNLRYLPRPDMLVEVTCRTIQSRFLLRPGKRLNEIFVGCLAKARGLFPVKVHGVVAASNHYHLLVSPADGEQLSRFMRHFNTNLSKEIGRLHDWQGTVFNRRYRAIPVSDETPAQVARLRYLLSHGAKEGVVLSPGDWPGVHSVDALLTGNPLRGVWYDRSRGGATRRQSTPGNPRAHAAVMEVELEPLPCWKELSEVEQQQEVKVLTAEIERETLSHHGKNGTVPSGARVARRVHPHKRPRQSKKTPAPRFHAWARRQRKKLEYAYSEFLAAYRAAAQQLRDGDPTVRFPDWCFPPARPFVRANESLAPG